MQSSLISFKTLEFKDIPLLYKWLNTDLVKEWYGKKDVSLAEVNEKYSKYITKEKPTDAYIIQIDGNDVGYIQTYMIKDYPDYDKYVQANEGSAGLDLYIGEPNYIHKSYGKYIISKFLNDIIFANPSVSDCILGPEPSNLVAIKTYSKVGFIYIKTIQVPDENTPEYLMQITREDFENSYKLI